jgi:hypothetical protein
MLSHVAGFRQDSKSSGTAGRRKWVAKQQPRLSIFILPTHRMSAWHHHFSAVGLFPNHFFRNKLLFRFIPNTQARFIFLEDGP